MSRLGIYIDEKGMEVATAATAAMTTITSELLFALGWVCCWQSSPQSHVGCCYVLKVEPRRIVVGAILFENQEIH